MRCIGLENPLVFGFGVFISMFLFHFSLFFFLSLPVSLPFFSYNLPFFSTFFYYWSWVHLEGWFCLLVTTLFGVGGLFSLFTSLSESLSFRANTPSLLKFPPYLRFQGPSLWRDIGSAVHDTNPLPIPFGVGH